jgi:HEAT repeat protein
MPDRYEPKSFFLRALIDCDVLLSGGEFAEANLRLLIEMTRDDDLSNRDWAVFLLAQADIDSPEVRHALIQAATDSEDMVRAEAAWGLAQRDPLIALPFVQVALRASSVCYPALEAAELCAHPSLIEDLRVWAQPSDHKFADEQAADALAACEAAAKGSA